MEAQDQSSANFSSGSETEEKQTHNGSLQTTDSLTEFPQNFFSQNLRTFFNEPPEREWQAPFSFVIFADTQFGLIERFIRPCSNPRWEEEIALTSAAIKCVNDIKPKPKFLVLCGDMLDSPPLTEFEQQLRSEQLQDFFKVFRHLDPDIPVISVCGNHDVGDNPTETSYRIYKKDFGPDIFSFWAGGVKFCVLNSQLFKSPNELISAVQTQKQFIENMADPRAVHMVVFQHIPFFVQHPDEDNFAWLNIDKPLRHELMETLRDAGVNYIFAGHYHRNGGGKYKNICQVVTSAVGGTYGTEPSGFRLCTVTRDEILHHYIPVIVSPKARGGS